MNENLPNAKSEPWPPTSPDLREKLRRTVARLGLCGLANDTKWDEFITAMRARPWRPSYRYKCIEGRPSNWDVEWFHHLPFPLLAVEWLDIVYLVEKQQQRGALLPSFVKTTDHSDWIEKILRQVGLDYRKGNTMIRVYGYSPRSLELFDE